MAVELAETPIISFSIDQIDTKIIDFCDFDLYSRLYSVSAQYGLPGPDNLLQVQGFINQRNCRIPLIARSDKNLRIDARSYSGTVSACALSRHNLNPIIIGREFGQLCCSLSGPVLLISLNKKTTYR